MDDAMLLGIWRAMVRVPPKIWQAQMHRDAGGSDRLGFMSADHHRIRDLAVIELPRASRPLAPQFFAERLGLPLDRVVAILEELERNMTFLFRNEEGAVTWAYPVTVDRTPHRVTFSSGERVNAA